MNARTNQAHKIERGGGDRRETGRDRERGIDISRFCFEI
jgi:hypothetical protein